MSQLQKSVSESSLLCKNPITLSWRVTLEVALKDGSDKTILNNVVGEAKPGNLIALIGASGAGKTSLLNCLSLRNSKFQGEVLVNGKVPGNEFPLLSGFVQQEDLFIPSLTVREHLVFQAILRLGDQSPLERVEEIIEALGLLKCSNSLIGGQGSIIRGISGGEKKRLAFATEILTRPSLFFVDEPTSGLDAFMAESVVQQLRDLADQGHTIISTIHQPSSDTFAMFTHLLLLSEGRIAYYGERSAAVDFFAEMGFSCPPFYNPADFFIGLLAIDPSDRLKSLEKCKGITDSYSNSELCKVNSEWTKKYNLEEFKLSQRSRLQRFRRQYRTTRLTQILVLMRRTATGMLRDPVVTRIRFLQTIALAVFIGLMYLQMAYNQDRVQDRMGLLFFVVTTQSVLGLFGVLQIFPLQLPVVLREHFAGAYRIDSFFLGQTLAEFPLQIVYPIIFSCILYWMTNLNNSGERFGMFILIVICVSSAAISCGYLVSASTRSVSVAFAVAPLALLPFLLTSGLLINISSIPDFFVWVEAFSFFKHGYSALSVNEWKGVELDCPTTCRFPTGDSVISYLELSEENIGLNILYLILITIAFRVFALGMLIRRSFSREEY